MYNLKRLLCLERLDKWAHTWIWYWRQMTEFYVCLKLSKKRFSFCLLWRCGIIGHAKVLIPYCNIYSRYMGHVKLQESIQCCIAPFQNIQSNAQHIYGILIYFHLHFLWVTQQYSTPSTGLQSARSHILITKLGLEQQEND